MFLNDIIFFNSITTTWTLTFGYIKWNPDVAFTGSFPDIVFGQYFRQEMGKISPHKWEISLSSPVLIENIDHGGMSVSWKWEAGVWN